VAFEASQRFRTRSLLLVTHEGATTAAAIFRCRSGSRRKAARLPAIDRRAASETMGLLPEAAQRRQVMSGRPFVSRIPTVRARSAAGDLPPSTCGVSPVTKPASSR
jgi:hypothetical protein